jgi:hypothetical protein
LADGNIFRLTRKGHHSFGRKVVYILLFLVRGSSLPVGPLLHPARRCEVIFLPWSRLGTERVGSTRRLVGRMSVRLFDFRMMSGACCCGVVLAVPWCSSRSIAGGRPRSPVALRLWTCSDCSLFTWGLLSHLTTSPSRLYNATGYTFLFAASISVYSF